jgi:putative heme-binding domain-containing protein
LGECGQQDANATLAEILVRNSHQRDVVDAAMTSINKRAGPVLERLVNNEDWIDQPDAEFVLSTIAEQIVRQGSEAGLSTIVRALETAHPNAGSAATRAILYALRRLPAESFQSNGNSTLGRLERLRRTAADALVRQATALLAREEAPVDERVDAIRTLSLGTLKDQQALLDRLLMPQQPPEIHAAVLAACAHFDAPAVADLVLSHWASLGPGERTQATELLLRREPWTLALLRHIAEVGIPLASFDPVHVARLENYPSEEVRKHMRALRGNTVAADRQQVFKEYRDFALRGGDPARGMQVFEKNCATCHAIKADGATVGPNLATMVSRGAESLLFNVLVPNGEVDPRYLEYVLLTVDGQVISGVIAGETSTAVTIRSADNKNTTVLRMDIEELHNSGKSLMPEGFEKVIDKEAMASLLAYLQEAAVKGAEK